MNRILTCALLLGLASLPVIAISANRSASAETQAPDEPRGERVEEERRSIVMERVNAAQIEERIRVLEERIKAAKDRGLELTRGVEDELAEQRKLLEAAKAGEDTFRLRLRGEEMELEDLIKRLAEDPTRSSLPSPEYRFAEVETEAYYYPRHGMVPHADAYKVMELSNPKITMLVDTVRGHTWHLAPNNQNGYEWKFIEREQPVVHRNSWPPVSGPGTRGNRGPGLPPVPPAGRAPSSPPEGNRGAQADGQLVAEILRRLEEERRLEAARREAAADDSTPSPAAPVPGGRRGN
jgi:hypothetical protein